MKTFLAGAAAGAAGSVIVLIATFVVMGHWAEAQPLPAERQKSLTIDGAAVSRNGGAAVELIGHGELRITCRDGCDDLAEEERTTVPHAVRVLDRSGRCLLCRERFTPAEEALDRWTLDGRPGLALSGASR